jgi:hypothetical protein
VTVSTPNGYQYVYADPCKSAALCLHFDEEAGPRTYDSSMHDNNVSIGTNIIPNSDFESGLWISGAQWLLDSGYSGYGARLNNSNSYCNDYQYKDLTVTQNKSYSIGAWIKTNEVQSGFYAAVGIAVPLHGHTSSFHPLTYLEQATGHGSRCQATPAARIPA